MSNWLINISENYSSRMYDYMHKQLLKLEHIGVDETSVNVLHEMVKTLNQNHTCGCI